jgi:hypothetical protein
MFILTPADGLCCVSFIYRVLCWFWCPEIETNSIDWARQSRILPEGGDRVQSPKCCFIYVNIKNWTMDNVQKVSNCIHIPSS